MAEKDSRIIGARIAERRHQCELTQVELAAALGVSPSSVADWERGASYPKRKMGKIKQLLGSDIDEIDEPRRPSGSAEEALERAQRELDELRRIIRDQRPGKGDGDRAHLAI